MKGGDKVKVEIENAVDQKRFNINDMYRNIKEASKHVSTETSINTVVKLREQLYTKKEKENILKNIDIALIRFSFLIELVKDDVSSTKFEYRWTHRLAEDVRQASFDECLAIYTKLLKDILEFEEYFDLVVSIVNTSTISVAYDVPLDYIKRFPENDKIHTLENIEWIESQLVSDIVLTRTLLFDDTYNSDKEVFERIKSKVKVKSYLTDRALTGVNKTNREKRWETHPQSVQFALRKDCYQIENKLFLQVCTFLNAPDGLVENLKESNQIDPDFIVFKCPIIGRVVDYNEFKESVMHTVHGKSNYQVGHMNPLKSVSDGVFGHTAANISWITEDGNRIQGSLELTEVKDLLNEIFLNLGLINKGN